MLRKTKQCHVANPKTYTGKRLKLPHPSSSLFYRSLLWLPRPTYPYTFKNGEFFPFSKKIRFHSNLFRPSTPKRLKYDSTPSRGAYVLLCMTSSYSKASDPLSLKQYTFHWFPLGVCTLIIIIIIYLYSVYTSLF